MNGYMFIQYFFYLYTAIINSHMSAWVFEELNKSLCSFSHFHKNEVDWD